MTNGLTDLVHLLQQQIRPVTISTDLGPFIYNDGDKEYRPMITPYARRVSNIESLAQAVIEEARRRKNEDGDHMTVIFNMHGGKFFTDDRERQDTWVYERSLSQQWEELKNSLNNKYSHLEFLRRLQKLAPSIQDFIPVFREFSKVSFSSNTNIDSSPILEEGVAGSQYSVILEAKGGQSKVNLPAGFVVKLPFARASQFEYEMQCELEVGIDEESHSGKKKIFFTLLCPELEAVVEKALKDEVEYFKQQTESLPLLLTLLSY